MKKMFTKIVMKSFLLLMAVTVVFSLNSCKNGDDRDDNNGKGNNYKITLTLNGIDADDYVSFTLAGVNNTADTSVWKINGQTQTGQIGIGMNADQFTGSTKTYVIESNFPLVSVASGFSVSNLGAGTITGNLKIEKNGNEAVNQPVNLTTDGASIIKQYNL